MELNYHKLGLKKNYLYEVLATTYSIFEGNVIPNTACMGIRIIKDKVIKIRPYHNTKTYENIKANKFIVLNFVENVYLYALAALKEIKSKIDLYIFPENLYSFLEIDKQTAIEKIYNEKKYSEEILLPFITESWAIVICEAFKEKEGVKENDIGKSLLSEFHLNIIKIIKFKESFKLFNRAENLALESILSATRLKIAYNKKDQLLYSKYLELIKKNIENVKRFGKNLNALKAINLVENYIKQFED
ncbi:MAG: DUF447 domain-containing protein [Candidatus Thorarchaeota archaeon]